MRTIHAAFSLVFAATLAPPAAAVDPTGRDPFSAYPDDVTTCFTSPLQSVPLGALQVQGVVAATSSPRALVLLPDGTSHLVRVGDGVGKQYGRVAAITPQGVVVDEEFRDAFGKRHPQRTLLAVR